MRPLRTTALSLVPAPALPVPDRWPPMPPQRSPSVLRPVSGSERLPPAASLAALGTVLCLHRGDAAALLEGWRRAVRVEWSARVDSDGLDECLCFFDAVDRLCWRLHSLPDSDLLGWEGLSRRLPRRIETRPCIASASAYPPGCVADRLWRRLADRLQGTAWRACTLQLQAIDSAGAELRARPVSVSPLGGEVAGRICRAEGVEGPWQRRVR